MYNNLA